MKIDSEVKFRLGLFSKLSELGVSLRPCPFCGATLCNLDTKVDRQYDGYGEQYFRVYYIECTRCGARSASKTELVKAAEAWNRRPNNDED